MVLLVRCSDNTCSVALKSRLKELINEGLVTAFLRNGEWVAADKDPMLGRARQQKRKPASLTASI
jgi:hypothetical protein